MMVALLLIVQPRGLLVAPDCAEEWVDFMAVTALNKPDFRTIAKFRRRHLKAPGDLFVQVLKCAGRPGW
jgi:hypothetical protein